jgi:hypothetical protein
MESSGHRKETMRKKTHGAGEATYILNNIFARSVFKHRVSIKEHG